MNAAMTGCLKCGSQRVSREERRLHPTTGEPLSAGLYLFLYLVSCPAVFLGLLLATREGASIYGMGLVLLALVAFTAAVLMHRTWRHAEPVMYDVCKSCGYARTDDDPLPVIEADGGVFLEPFSKGA